MPAEPPPPQPSPAELWHIEEMRRRRLLEWERQQAEEHEWWESLTPAERAEIERERAQKAAEEAAEAEEKRREAKERAVAHGASVKEYEGAHGGTDYLDNYEEYLKERRTPTPVPDYSISAFGGLLVLMLFALLPGLFFNSAFHSSGGGILLTEGLALVGWGALVMHRRERAILHTKLAHEGEKIARQRGCGDVDCRECYPDQYFRSRWEHARATLGHSGGCAAPDCEACYPASGD